MRRFFVALLFLLAGTFSFAQTSSDRPSELKDSTFTNDQIGCPVGFSASRQATGQVLSADDATQSGPTQGLHLTLRNFRGRPAIESIEVTVYGTSQKGLFLPVGQQATDTVSKTFNLHRTSGSPSLSDADVSMHLVGSLSWVDLISVTYADGHTWHASEDLKCRAVPSNFLLVGKK
jgi:hypothetical protein